MILDIKKRDNQANGSKKNQVNKNQVLFDGFSSKMDLIN